MGFSKKGLEYIERTKRKKEEKRRKQIQKWHDAGVKARKKKKEKEKREREKERKKRPVGRPKKRGPKRKRRYNKVKKVLKPRPRCDFKIVGVTNGRQNEYVGAYHTSEEAYDAFDKLKEQNNSVVFERKVINNLKLKDSKDEYLILEKNRYGDKENPLIRNEFGKLVENKTNGSKWVVFDKMERKIEEHFWVYGYDPLCDRKTFIWIFDNIINVFEDEYDMKRVILFKNKVIIKKDDGDMDIILCKNRSDGVRFYTILSEWMKKENRVIFIGDMSRVSEMRRNLEKEIAEKTGWDKRKIQSPSTRA